MAGKVNLGDNLDAAGSRIFHNLAKLRLGVVAAVADSVVGIEVLAYAGAVPPCSNLREAGVGLDFDPPALVVGEVPVQAVEFVGRHHVNVALCLFD